MQIGYTMTAQKELIVSSNEECNYIKMQKTVEVQSLKLGICQCNLHKNHSLITAMMTEATIPWCFASFSF